MFRRSTIDEKEVSSILVRRGRVKEDISVSKNFKRAGVLSWQFRSRDRETSQNYLKTASKLQ